MQPQFLHLKYVIGTVTLVSLIIFSCANRNSTSVKDHNTWWHYGGSPDQSKFFNTSEITKENVGDLEVAWHYPIADNNMYFFSPIVVDSVMYVMAKNYSLVALDINTGKEIWIHANLRGISRRGLNYWQNADGTDRRLIFTLNNSLQAIDAATGKTITTFGKDGFVDLRQGLNRPPESIRRMQAMMPGVLFEDLVIVGSAPGEGYFSPPGYVRAYNVVTGELAWNFHTVPLPGEYGHDTWPEDAYKYVGGVNVWSEMSVDEKNGMVFLPLGSPTYDYYGVDRLGANLFGNCLVALNARTGERIWHYQTVHHDLWDYDLSPAPQLLTVEKDGKKIEAVSVATKHGFVFVFDRKTGKPLFPIEERPFPPSNMPGEEAWPTQPISTLPDFTRHEVTPENLNPYLPDSIRAQWLERLKTSKSGLFVPPSDQYETVMMPGALGGANFGNTAADPNKGIMYIMTQEYASTYKLNKVGPPKIDMSKNELEKIQAFYDKTCMSCHGKKMEGGAGPAIANSGQNIFFDEFKGIILNGKGQMPGFTHVDEETLRGLHRFMGGNGRSFNFGPPAAEKSPEGPVVASGGAKIPADTARASAMTDYPAGVDHPADRYTTDYGLDWMGLLSPPWSSLLAYDLNKGTVLWKRPVGLDSLYAKGDESLGAPNGTQRKGMVITSSGVILATAKGGQFYAIDASTGKTLWKTETSYEANAQPTMFTFKGKDYIVLNASANFRNDSYDFSKRKGALPKSYVVYTVKNKN